jgi:hypothetical protein
MTYSCRLPFRWIAVALTACLVLLPLICNAHAADVDPIDTNEAATAYSGVLIDARPWKYVDRSPAPAIFGPAPQSQLLYPDRTHVPTPDEVQEQSIVRYYHSIDEAKSFVGEHPLIIHAADIVGPGHDCVALNAEDAARLQELDKQIHFTRTWKVGFLIPEDR